MTASMYLKPNVITEPLINGWYAWSYLLSPHHLAMCTANKQLKIMESFIKAPLIHQNSVKNPALTVDRSWTTQLNRLTRSLN